MIKRAVALISLAAHAVASDFSLQLPIDCTLGKSCYIQQFVDHDPNASASDFTCGPLTYDTHKGTDFALQNLAAMTAGVDVLAAAGGRVVATRDGMPDQLYTPEAAAQIEGRDCGNGLVIDHGSGWRTQYCHLKQGSIIVDKGQRVETGAVLGEVGLSGRTQFPHLHMTVRKNDQVVDPFATEGRTACRQTDATLWLDPPNYAPGGLIQAGFTTDTPDYATVKQGLPSEQIIATDAAQILIWMHVFGVRDGDHMALRLDGPQGEIVQHSAPQTRNRAQAFQFAGKRRPDGGWPQGDYTAILWLMRNGAAIDTMKISATVE